MSEIKDNVSIDELRLWDKNPRYTSAKEISFRHVGEEDYTFDSNGSIANDLYNEKVPHILNQLIRTKKSVDSMYELVESMSTGYNSDIDEIIVCRAPILDTKENRDAWRNTFYVLEGNRRLLSIYLLKNKYNAREMLFNKYPSYKTKFSKIFMSYDNAMENQDYSYYKTINDIQVKLYDLDVMSDDDIWKTLNARHFGQRKGKENWPRGLVLESIFNAVVDFRSGNNIHDGEEISHEHKQELISKLENRTGKSIDDGDLSSALFVVDSIRIWGEKKNKNFSFSDTDSEEAVSEIQNDSTKKDSFLSVSALELSMNTIKILSDQGLSINLRNAIGLEININKWKVTTDKISINNYENLITYVIDLIFERVLTTRGIDSAYINMVSEIAFGKGKGSVPPKDASKINFNSLTASSILKAKDINELKKKVAFSDDQSDREKQVQELQSYIDSVVPIYNDIFSTISFYKNSDLDSIKNKFEYGFVNLWTNELNTLVRNNEINVLSETPINVFGSALRITSDLLIIWILSVTAYDNSELENEFKRYSVDENNNENLQLNKVKKFSSREGMNVSEIVGNFVNSKYVELQAEDNIDISESDISSKNLFKAIVRLLEIRESKSGNTENDIKRRIVETFIEKLISDHVLSDSALNCIDNLTDFIKWSTKPEDRKGRSNLLNDMIHNPHKIKEIKENASLKDKIYGELKHYVGIIMKFVRSFA